MIRSRRSKWVSGLGAVVLIGGLVLANYGAGVSHAAPPASNPGNPFQAILDKLDQVLAAITGASGESNPTLRWDQKLPVATRFVVLSDWNSEAVLDRETGLVWERSPESSAVTWSVARVICVSKPVVNRKGWRLPSIPELASLIDFSQRSPALPPGHPFTNVLSVNYWSATTNAGLPADAWIVNFFNGHVDAGSKTLSGQVWCVRGGMNADAY